MEEGREPEGEAGGGREAIPEGHEAGMVGVVEAMANAGKDPRQELWEGLCQSFMELKERLARSEASLVEAEEVMLSLRLENETLRARLAGLEKSEKERLLQQARNAFLTPGEDSLVERP